MQALHTAVLSHESDLHDVALAQLLLLNTDAVTLNAYSKNPSNLPSPDFIIRPGASEVVEIGRKIWRSHHSLITNIDTINLATLNKVQTAYEFEVQCRNISSKLQVYAEKFAQSVCSPVEAQQVVNHLNEQKVGL